MRFSIRQLDPRPGFRKLGRKIRHIPRRIHWMGWSRQADLLPSSQDGGFQQTETGATSRPADQRTESIPAARMVSPAVAETISQLPLAHKEALPDNKFAQNVTRELTDPGPAILNTPETPVPVNKLIPLTETQNNMLVHDGGGHSQKPSSTGSEVSFRPDTPIDLISKLANMAFEVELPDGQWHPVTVQIDTGMDGSVLMKPFADEHGIRTHSVKKNDLQVFVSPVIGESVTLTRFAKLRWKSAELGCEPFDTDLLITPVAKVNGAEINVPFVAIFGRRVIKRQRLWDLITQWMERESQRPRFASPLLIVGGKRDEATTRKDKESWDTRQQLHAKTLKDIKAEITSTASSSDQAGGAKSAFSQNDGNQATTSVTSADVGDKKTNDESCRHC